MAIIIRVVPAPGAVIPDKTPTLSEFFQLEWVNQPGARPEILFLHRENAQGSDETLFQAKLRSPTNEAHVAFPGGRQEADDEGGLYTAMRQTWEEIGIDLAEPCYTSVGQLDDREITTSLGKRLLMILSPFVFLQLTPTAPAPDTVPSTALHWIPLASLVTVSGPPKWSNVTVDAASRLVPKHSPLLKFLVRVFIGSMEFPAIILQNAPSSPSSSKEKQDAFEKGFVPPRKQVLKLWGLSLGMTLDLMSYMILPAAPQPQQPLTPESPMSSPLSPVMQLPYQETDDFKMEYVAPSLASVFPRFSYPDVNFWIW